MKLAHYHFMNPILIEDNFLYLVVEGEQRFYEYCQDFYRQCNGEDGKFVFTQNNSALALKTVGIFLSDIFSISLQDKKLVTGLQDSIVRAIEENYQVEQLQAISSIFTLLEKAAIDSDLPIAYEPTITMMDIVKVIKLHYEEEGQTLLENVINYLSALQSYTKKKIVIFVNLKNFLSDEDMKVLLQHIRYSSLTVIMLEHCQPNRVDGEDMLIIDKDDCEILVKAE